MMIFDLFYFNWLLIGLSAGIIWSIWDTPGRPLGGSGESVFDPSSYLKIIVSGFIIWWFFGDASVANNQDPAWLMSQAIKLSKEGAKLIEQSLILVATVTVSQQTSNIELENLSYEINQSTEEIIPEIISEVIAENTTVSRFNYYQEIFNFINHHPWLTLIGILTFGLSGWYLYSRYNRRQRLNSLVFRPINLFIWLSGLVSLTGLGYLYYRGYDYQTYLLVQKIAKTYHTISQLTNQAGGYALQGIQNVPPIPPDITELSFLLFFKKQQKIVKFYFLSFLILIGSYFLNFFNQLTYTTRYGESAKLSREINQKMLKLQKLAEIEQKDLTFFIQSTEKTQNESLVQLAKEYSTQNKQTVDLGCQLTQKISQADHQMVKACQIIKKSNQFEANLGQRTMTVEEYFLDSFTYLAQLPKSSLILLVFFVLILIFVLTSYNSPLIIKKETLEKSTQHDKTIIDFLLYSLIGTILSGLIFLAISTYHIQLANDEIHRLLLTHFTLQIGDTLLGICFFINLVFLILTIHFFINQSIIKKYRFFIGGVGILGCFYFLNFLTYFKFILLFFFFFLFLF